MMRTDFATYTTRIIDGTRMSTFFCLLSRIFKQYCMVMPNGSRRYNKRIQCDEKHANKSPMDN